MHLPHIAGHHTHLEPPGQATSGLHPLAQRLQGHQLELSDAIALPVDHGLQSAAIDLEFGFGVVVARFAKSRKFFKPVHCPSPTDRSACNFSLVTKVATSLYSARRFRRIFQTKCAIHAFSTRSTTRRLMRSRRRWTWPSWIRRRARRCCAADWSSTRNMPVGVCFQPASISLTSITARFRIFSTSSTSWALRTKFFAASRRWTCRPTKPQKRRRKSLGSRRRRLCHWRGVPASSGHGLRAGGSRRLHDTARAHGGHYPRGCQYAAAALHRG